MVSSVSASIEELGVALAEAIEQMPEAKKAELRKGWLASAEMYLRERRSNPTED